MIKKDILRHLALLKRRATNPVIQGKISRLAELNLRSIGTLLPKLSSEEVVERNFLSMTLPHARRRGEIKELLKQLP